MKKVIPLFILLITNLSFSQIDISETTLEFRPLTGKVLDEFGQPLPGQNVIIKGTIIGTTTDFNGEFCLMVPKNKTIFIEVPFCFDHLFREISSTDEAIELRFGKEKRKTKKAWRKYQKVNTTLVSYLNTIYQSNTYKTIAHGCK